MSIRLRPKAFFASTLIGLLSIMRHPLISFANMHPVHNQTNHHRQHHDHHGSGLLPIVVSDQQPRVAAFGCVLIRKQGLTRLDIMFIVVIIIIFPYHHCHHRNPRLHHIMNFKDKLAYRLLVRFPIPLAWQLGNLTNRLLASMGQCEGDLALSLSIGALLSKSTTLLCSRLQPIPTLKIP